MRCITDAIVFFFTMFHMNTFLAASAIWRFYRATRVLQAFDRPATTIIQVRVYLSFTPPAVAHLWQNQTWSYYSGQSGSCRDSLFTVLFFFFFFFFPVLFLVANLQLHNRLRPSVCWSVRWSIRWSIRLSVGQSVSMSRKVGKRAFLMPFVHLCEGGVMGCGWGKDMSIHPSATIS